MIRKPQPNEIDQVRLLFIEYQQRLGIDLCFQQFEAELASLPGAYAEPKGANQTKSLQGLQYFEKTIE